MENRQERSHVASGATSELDIRSYWHTVKKRRWIILGVLVAVLGGALGWTVRQPRIYQSQALVIIDPQAPNILGTQVQKVVELGSGAYWGNREYYNTQFSIIKGRALARKIVRKYQLHHDRRLLPKYDESMNDDSLVELAAADLQRRLTVTQQKDNRVVAIEATARDPKLAADLANDVADVYIEQNVQVKVDTTQDAAKWITTKLDEAKRTLNDSEGIFYNFRREKNILSVGLEDRQNLIMQGLTEFRHAQTEAERERIDLEAKRNAVASLVAGDVTDAASTKLFGETGALDTLRASYMEERRKLRDLEERYGPKHPDVSRQAAHTGTMLADLKDEAKAVMRSIGARVRALSEAEHRYATKVEQLTTEALQLGEHEKEYKQHARDAVNAEKVYGMLLTRLNESGLQEQDRTNNIRYLEEARPGKTPVEPNVKKSLLAGLAFGLMFGLILAFVVEYLDRSVKSQEDIEQAIGVPFLGLVPSVDDTVVASAGGAPEFYIVRHPNSTVAECCRVVRTNLLFCSPDKPLKTLLVTSSNPVEGKTMTVVHIGIVMAQSGHRTLVVDTDMRRPRLHKALRVTNEVGASRVIVGESDIDSAIKSTDVPNLFIMPCGPIPPNPAELIQTEKFTALVRKLEEKFDRVIFDSPPVLAVTDAALLSRVTDGVVLVVRAGRTNRDAVVRAKQILDSVQARLVGAILNDVNLKNPHYYYHYYHYYQYKYHDVPTAADAVEKG